MYSEEDINSAIEAGALSEDAAASFRDYMTELRGITRRDEENFRLLTSFNDVFVAIGVCILLFAMGAIGAAIVDKSAPSSIYDISMIALVPAGLVAATSWALAEFFTRRRRMALPSIILLIAFVWSIMIVMGALVLIPFGLAFGPEDFSQAKAMNWQPDETQGIIILSSMMLITAVLTTIATWLHWKRFMVPITVAAGTAALVGILIATIKLSSMLALGDGSDGIPMLPMVFVAGLLTFAFAMWWDLKDPERITRRSDVAFWLHLLAAPLIAHPIFNFVGVTTGGDLTIFDAVLVLGIYVVFGIVALIVDRRALLVSALVYVLFALAFLFDRFGSVELTVALTALVIGSALLTLSAFWAPIRRGVLGIVPEDWRDALPSSEQELVAA
ncbi:MAG: hypothetical protein GW855_12400 [Erythrobacter sp.]|nr:hypothetical protein [Erythrobacter sp.]NCQ64689.1 hypothetical protein [Alphaproteobacteria bacterium]